MIRVNLVTIIASLITRFTGTKLHTHDTVTAARKGAVVGAGILIHTVTVITGLGCVLGSITADTATFTDAVVKGTAAQRDNSEGSQAV